MFSVFQIFLLLKSLKKGTVTLLVKRGQRIRRRSSSNQPPGVTDITIPKSIEIYLTFTYNTDNCRQKYIMLKNGQTY